MAVASAVLIALDEQRVAARDDEPGRRIAREVAVDVRRGALVVVLNRRLGCRTSQRRWSVATPDKPALEDAIEMMERLARDPATAGLCLVELSRGGGSLAGFESSTTLRVLP